MKARCGFTLIEILVVVSLVGILAVIVIPRYHSGKNEAKLACLCTNLHVGRRQIELYKIQHNCTLPAGVGETSADFTRRMMTWRSSRPTGSSATPSTATTCRNSTSAS